MYMCWLSDFADAKITKNPPPIAHFLFFVQFVRKIYKRGTFLTTPKRNNF